MKVILMSTVLKACGGLGHLHSALINSDQPTPTLPALGLMMDRDRISGRWLAPILYALCVWPRGPRLDINGLFTDATDEQTTNPFAEAENQ